MHANFFFVHIQKNLGHPHQRMWMRIAMTIKMKNMWRKKLCSAFQCWANQFHFILFFFFFEYIHRANTLHQFQRLVEFFSTITDLHKTDIIVWVHYFPILQNAINYPIIFICMRYMKSSSFECDFHCAFFFKCMALVWLGVFGNHSSVNDHGSLFICLERNLNRKY